MMNEKLIEKVKKLLELASSPNEHEARLAFSRAQELISRYALDITGEQKAETVIERVYELKIKSAAVKDNLLAITSTIAKIFSCQSLYFPATREFKIFGFETNVEITIHAIDCILNQLAADFRIEYQKHRTISFSGAFWKAATDALKVKFSENINVGAGLVLYDKTSAYIKANYSPKTKSNDSDSSYAKGKVAGTEAGMNANIRFGITPTSNVIKRLN